MKNRKARIVLATGKMYRDGFHQSLRVKDWTVVTNDDKPSVWGRWSPKIGRKVRIVAEVL